MEDDKRYRATLDKAGNGPYTQHGGRFTTSRFSDRLWQGTWQQPGNDREGGFEILLSEDGKEAKGVWWYTRVGTHKNIPPREHGGTYQWKRITSGPHRPLMSKRSDHTGRVRGLQRTPATSLSLSLEEPCLCFWQCCCVCGLRL